MKILVTGAGGQLGQELVAALAGEEVQAVRRAELDVADRKCVLELAQRTRPQVIINAAAFNDVDGAEAAREQAFAVNRDGPANLAEAALRVNSRLIHISTDYVFNGRKGDSYSEDDPADPLSVYGESKRAGEIRVLESEANACVLRTAWLYGAAGKNFVKAILAAAGAGKPLRVVADQVGSPTASADLAVAIRELLQTNSSGLFHVANQGACSRFEFARAIVKDKAEVIPVSATEVPRPAARPANSSLRSIRWAEAGLTPLRSWQDALSVFLRSGLARG